MSYFQAPFQISTRHFEATQPGDRIGSVLLKLGPDCCMKLGCKVIVPNFGNRRIQFGLCKTRDWFPKREPLQLRLSPKKIKRKNIMREIMQK